MVLNDMPIEMLAIQPMSFEVVSFDRSMGAQENLQQTNRKATSKNNSLLNRLTI